MSDSPSLRQSLRELRVFSGELPRFDTDAAPDAPLILLVDWLEYAIESGVAQPHAASLATVSVDGVPSNRTLLLKDVDDSAVWLASLSSGPKGADLATNPVAALTLYWREQGRQVRIVGPVEAGPRERSEADFLQRHPNARAVAIAGDQSERMSPADAAPRLEAARARIADEPDYVPDEWVAYRLQPTSVEFWQAERERDQVRLRYVLGDGSGTGPVWTQERLWP